MHTLRQTVGDDNLHSIVPVRTSDLAALDDLKIESDLPEYADNR